MKALEVSRNFHGNVCSEVLSKVVAFPGSCRLPELDLLIIKILPRFWEHESSFLEVFCRSSCSASEAVAWRCSQNSQENICARVIKDSGTGAFVWILRNF